MPQEFNTGTDADLNEAVKSRYEANDNTNAFTDAEKTKLAAIPADAEANTVDSVNGATGSVVLTADDIDDATSAQKFATASQLAKIDSVEDGATADQTGAEIKIAYENEADTNSFTDGEKTKLAGVEVGATADQTGAEIKASYEGEANTNAFTDAEKTKLAGLESSKYLGTFVNLGALQTTYPSPAIGSYAHVDAGVGSDVAVYIWDNDDAAYIIQAGSPSAETAASIKSKYESNADTNSYTDVEKTKLAGVANNATANSGALSDEDTVGTAHIDDGAVTLPKLAPISTARILGRVSLGSGEVEALTDAQVRTLVNAVSAIVLASTNSGEGSDLIGLGGIAGIFTGNTVSAALQQIRGEIDDFGDMVEADQDEFVRTDEREVIIFDAGGDINAARPSQSPTKMVIWFNHGDGLPTNRGPYDLAAGLGQGVAQVKTDATASRTLDLSDAGINIDRTNASANTVTIPDNATVAFPINTTISITWLGAGQPTIQGDTGVQVNGTPAGSVAINAQRSGCVLRQFAIDEWIVQGDIT